MALDERLDACTIDRDHAYLERVALSLVGRSPDADDVVQEVWLEVLEHPPRHTERFHGWLRLAASHAVARLRRGERRRKRRELAVARPDVGPGEVVDSVARASFLREVENEIERLDEPYRSVLRLRCLEELTAEEIAARTGHSPATVRSQAKRGLERIRERLDRAYGSRESWAVLALALPRPKVVALPPGKFAAIAAGLVAVAIGAAWFVLGRDDRGTTQVAVGSGETQDGPDAPAPLALSALAPGPRIATPAPGEAKGELALRAVREGDRTPLVGEAIHLERIGGLVTAGEWLETDAAGLAHREDLAVGSYRIQARRGEPAFAEVRADELAEIVLVLPAGVSVRGVAVDPKRRPVARAEILLSLPDRPKEARRVAVSDRNGAFAFDGADPSGWISARTPERLLSGAFSVGSAWNTGERAAVLEIVLPDATGRVTGLVLDSQEKPVRGACVRAYPQRTRVPWYDGRGVAKSEGPADLVFTDARGRFELPAPDNPLVGFLITSADRPAWLESLEAGKEVVIRLEEPAALAGLLRRADSKPAAGARVTCEGRFPEDRRSTIAGADGNYRFVGLGAGSWSVRAELERESAAGGAVAEVELAAGEARSLTLVLGPEAGIRGRAVDGEGEPFAGFLVSAEPEWLAEVRGQRQLLDDAGARATRTDGEGRFAFAALDPAPHRLRLEEPDDRRGIAWAVLDGVAPGGEEVVLRAPRAPGASLRGRLEGERSGVELSLRGRMLARPLRIELADGVFTCRALPGGAYELVAHRPGNEPFVVRSIELAPDVELDLGSFPLLRPGSAVLRLRTPDGSLLAGIYVLVQSSSGWRYATLDFPIEGIGIDPRGEVRFANLAPGRHFVLVKARGFADVFRSLEILPGGEIAEDVELEPGVPTFLRIESARTLAPDSELHFELSMERGTWTFTSRPSTPWDAGELLHFGLTLLPGEQRLEMRSDCGLACAATFDPSELEGRPLVLRLE